MFLKNLYLYSFMKNIIVLNADYLYLSKTSDRRALQLVEEGKAEMVKAGREVKTLLDKKIVPAILRLLKYIKKISKSVWKLRNKKVDVFKRHWVFKRDYFICQFCNIEFLEKFLTIDHVYPKSKGGKTEYTNCTTACINCNYDKADAILKDMQAEVVGWDGKTYTLKLLSKPYHPTFQQILSRLL